MNEQTPPGLADMPITRSPNGSVNAVTPDAPTEPFDLPINVNDSTPPGSLTPGPNSTVRQQP